MKFIILEGDPGRGKTTTLHALKQILIANGYAKMLNMGLLFDPIKQADPPDFLDFFSKGNKKVGITSRGDDYNSVASDLHLLAMSKCDVCICACHPLKKPHGNMKKRQSRNAVDDVIGLHSQLPSLNPTVVTIPKIYQFAKSAQLITNTIDARYIFSKI